MVENMIKNKSTMEKLNVTSCCMFFTLRSGTLAIGISLAITGVLWFIGGVTGGGGAYSGLFSGLLLLAAGVFNLLCFKKNNVDFLWYSVYILLGTFVWMMICIVILLVTLNIALGILSLINGFILLYFAAVSRSYAFELVDAPPPTSAQPTPA